MNKKVYLCDLEWTSLMKGLNIGGTPEDVLDKGGVKATIVFDDTIRYGELEKITKTKYFNITDEDYKSRIDKAIEYIENQLEGTRKSLEYHMKQYNSFGVAKDTRDCKLYANILEILEGDNNE